MCKTWYYKTIHESTGSVKYIKTSGEGCTVIVLGGSKPRMETSKNPYPMDSGEPFEPITEQDFKDARQQYTDAKNVVFTTH